jgi:enoyl-CoA hydratase/carnithine racemase
MLLFTGSRIDAREAARIGLVNQIVAGAELNDTVNDLAQRIAENAPLSLAAAKLAVHQAVREGIGCDQTALEAAIDRCYDSEDYREGRAAFREKRMPRFAGK